MNAILYGAKIDQNTTTELLGMAVGEGFCKKVLIGMYKRIDRSTVARTILPVAVEEGYALQLVKVTL